MHRGLGSSWSAPRIVHAQVQSPATGLPGPEKQEVGDKKTFIKSIPRGFPPDTILQPGRIQSTLAPHSSSAGVENPELLLARERVAEATALRQLAVAQLLPNLNVGTNYDAHQGALQQSAGNILQVNRDAMYVGLGANAVGGGTVNIPGLNYNLNVGEDWYGYFDQPAEGADLRAASLQQSATICCSESVWLIWNCSVARAIRRSPGRIERRGQRWSD